MFGGTNSLDLEQALIFALSSEAQEGVLEGGYPCGG